MKFEKVRLETFVKDCEKCGISKEFAEQAYNNIKMPKRSTIKSAGYDFVSPFVCDIPVRDTVRFPLGVKVEMYAGWVLFVMIRSSLGLKHGLIIPNCTGVIDADYYNNPDNEGDIFIAFRNEGKEKYRIQSGDKVAQGIFLKYGKTEDDNATGIRKGGVGSTGV